MSDKLEKYIDQLKFFYLIHGKSISEFSPDLNVLLRRYIIKKIYDYSQSNPSINKKCSDFLNSICGIDRAKKISSNFDADKICKYEDYISFIEKSFEQAECDFNDKILENNFDNYLQLISVYRLICDMSELIDCWKEKDENIEKFQKLCKFRCIQIISAKKEYDKGPQSEIDKEISEIEKNIKMSESLKLNKETDDKIINSDKKDDVNPQKNNNNISSQLNTQKISDNKKNLIVPKNNYNTNFIDIKENNPYLNITLNFKEAFKNTLKNNDNNKEKIDLDDFQLKDNPYNSIVVDNSQIKNSSILPQKKIIVKQISQEQEEIENMIKNLKGNSLQKENKNLNKKNSQQIKNINQNLNKNPKQNMIQSVNQEINKKSKQNITSSVQCVKFEQLKTNLLNNYKYPGNKKLNIKFPVIYRDVDYIYLLDYIKKNLIPETISKMEKNDLKSALSQSEMLLYYLVNITTKDSEKKNNEQKKGNKKK